MSSRRREVFAATLRVLGGLLDELDRKGKLDDDTGFQAIVNLQHGIATILDENEKLTEAAKSIEKTLDDYLHLGIAPSREMWYAERDTLRAAIGESE